MHLNETNIAQAFARALYSRKALLVVDDIFSGLDLRTSNLIIERVFSRNGLVRQLGMTVILATHAGKFY